MTNILNNMKPPKSATILKQWTFGKTSNGMNSPRPRLGSAEGGQKGFTIIEVLISAFVFSIIAITVSGLFVQILALQRRASASQKIQENGLFIMELMSREIRISQIVDSDQNPAGDSPNCTLTELTIRRPINVNYYATIKYKLTNGVLQRIAPDNLTDPSSPIITTNLSSSVVAFSRLNFCVMGSGQSDGQQARVAILASIQNKTGKEILTTSFETTVSSRDVQTEF